METPEIISFTKTWHSEPYPFISPSRPELSAAGKNIVVTGGGTGIGRAVSVAFAKAGAKSVIILGRRAEKLKEAAAVISGAAVEGNTEVLFKAADITDKDQVVRAFQSVVDKVGKIDVLVSNAAGPVIPGVLSQISPSDLDASFTSTVLTSLNVLQAFLPMAGPEPVLISTSTSMAHWLPTPGMGIYTIVKAAALKLFDVASRENPSLRIVNVQPGWVATDMNGHQKEAPDSRTYQVDPSILPNYFHLRGLADILSCSGPPGTVLSLAGFG